MGGFDYLVVGLLAISLISLSVQAIQARKDQTRAARAGERVGSLWHHIMRVHHQREAKRKAQHEAPSKPGPVFKPSSLISTPAKTTQAIRTGWSVGEVEFNYSDVDGVVSKRRVTVHSASKSHIKGECHERRAERTFRPDRIIGDVVNYETGEILSAKQWVMNIHL